MTQHSPVTTCVQTFIIEICFILGYTQTQQYALSVYTLMLYKVSEKHIKNNISGIFCMYLLYENIYRAIYQIIDINYRIYITDTFIYNSQHIYLDTIYINIQSITKLRMYIIYFTHTIYRVLLTIYICPIILIFNLFIVSLISNDMKYIRYEEIFVSYMSFIIK